MEGKRGKEENGRERGEGKVEEGSGPLICQNVVAPLPQGQKFGCPDTADTNELTPLT